MSRDSLSTIPACTVANFSGKFSLTEYGSLALFTVLQEGWRAVIPTAARRAQVAWARIPTSFGVIRQPRAHRRRKQPQVIAPLHAHPASLGIRSALHACRQPTPTTGYHRCYTMPPLHFTSITSHNFALVHCVRLLLRACGDHDFFNFVNIKFPPSLQSTRIINYWHQGWC